MARDTIPMMGAIVVSDDADQRRMDWLQIEQPEPAEDEVLVAVRATAVNRADLLQRIGRYPPPPGASPILGLEAAGEIVALGAGVDRARWRVGDRVCALLPGGGYAARAVCHADVLLPIPEGLSFVEAAALPEVLYTAYLNLFVEAAVQPGERVLVHAGGSGVGTMAIQLCRALGSPVYATASAGKLEPLRGLGVTAAIDREEDFVAAVRALANGRGVDVVLCPVGASYLQRNLEVLCRGGRLVVIGLLGGAKAELPLARLLTANLRVIGSTLRGRSVALKAELTRAIAERVWPLVGRGEVVPVIERTFPIAEAEAAHELLRSNRTVGKLVLEL